MEEARRFELMSDPQESVVEGLTEKR